MPLVIAHETFLGASALFAREVEIVVRMYQPSMDSEEFPFLFIMVLDKKFHEIDGDTWYWFPAVAP